MYRLLRFFSRGNDPNDPLRIRACRKGAGIGSGDGNVDVFDFGTRLGERRPVRLEALKIELQGLLNEEDDLISGVAGRRADSALGWMPVLDARRLPQQIAVIW
ncbi:MAG: hypothetical protein JW759_01790 [Candidatus Coatesbacteria bacterium]|nr:hypothetical protein [Candidatus Coatesbacteria bacterium]